MHCSDYVELIIENDLLIGSVFNFGPTAIFKKSLQHTRTTASMVNAHSAKATIFQALFEGMLLI